MDLAGTIDVLGKRIKWQRNPATGGWVIFAGSADGIHLDVEPTPEVAAIAISSYEQGTRHGERVGRSILQNEFRNLMDCQPR